MICQRLQKHKNFRFKLKIHNTNDLYEKFKETIEFWNKVDHVEERVWGLVAQNILYVFFKKLSIFIDCVEFNVIGSDKDVSGIDGILFDKYSFDIKSLYYNRYDRMKKWIFLDSEKEAKADLYIPVVFNYHENELYLYVLGVIDRNDLDKFELVRKFNKRVVDLSLNKFDEHFLWSFVK